MDANNLMDVYKSMLGTVGMDVTSDGYVRMSIGEGEYLPVTGQDGKSVVIPLPERLRDPNIGNLEVFHLLSENSKVNNSSDLMTRYRHWLINRYNLAIAGLGGVLLGIAADGERTKRLRPDQQDFLALVVDADVTSLQTFSKIADICSKPSQVQKVFMSMYLRQAAVNKLDKKSYHRVATVTFPFFEELKKLDEEATEAKKAPKGQKKQKVENVIFDVPIRIKDRAIFMGLMHYLIPGLDQPHAYDLGSNSNIAPSIDALMRAFYPLAKHLNEIVIAFKGVDNEIDRALEEIEFDLDWMDGFQNLDALWPQIRMTPNQNAGVIDEPTNTAPTAAHAAIANQPSPVTPPWPTPAQPQPVPAYGQPQGYPAPAVAPQPQAQRSSGGGVSVAEMMAASRGNRILPQPQPMGYPGGYPMQPQMGAYPGQPYPQAAYPQYQPAQPAPGPGFPNYAAGRRPY